MAEYVELQPATIEAQEEDDSPVIKTKKFEIPSTFREIERKSTSIPQRVLDTASAIKSNVMRNINTFERKPARPQDTNAFSRRKVRFSGLFKSESQDFNQSHSTSVSVDIEDDTHRLDMSHINDHRLPLSELCQKYDTNINLSSPNLSGGLTPSKVAERRAKHGKNTFPKRKPSSKFIKFVEAVTNIFNVLLFLAGLIYLIIFFVQPVENPENVWIGCTLMIVAFINAGIEFYQSQKIQNIVESLDTMVESKTQTLRQGEAKAIPSSELVPGDVIRLKTGDKVPADAILFYIRDFLIDSSSLTGETHGVPRAIRPEGCSLEVDPFDAPQFIFSSDVVLSGEGYAVVVRTGKDSVQGQINSLIRGEEKKSSQLTKEIKRFIRTISLLALVTAFIFFIVALARGRNFNYAASFGIGVLLAWVPQGLPLTITLILAISGSRMVKSKVIIKDLHSIETLGGITLLATDKTGTITRNEMVVTDIWCGNEYYYCGTDKVPKDSRAFRVDMPGIANILHISVTCSMARREKVNDEFVYLGDATEVGLMKFVSQRLANFGKLNDLYPSIFEVPFSSETKYHVTIHRKSHSSGGLTLHIKGAPEIIWAMCSNVWVNNRFDTINDAWFARFQGALNKYSSRGSRVIGFAMYQLPGDKYPDNYIFNSEKQNYPKSGYSFVGMMALEDPPKPEVAGAITEMRQAGVKVMMVTGDNALTAESISRQVNLVTMPSKMMTKPTSLPLQIPTEPQAVIATGEVLTHFSDVDWLHLFKYDEIVLARVSPAQKLELVQRAQNLGHIVGVTGDGVNDAPALKKADLGIAMNSGSDISKEKARMILLDDNFATIVTGIREGRLIFTNLKKAVRYSLSHIIPEVMVYLLYVVVPIPLALSASQLLMVDLGFELFMTLSFAWEPMENYKSLMETGPRKPINENTMQAYHDMDQRKKTSDLDLAKTPNDVDTLDSANLLHEMKGLERKLKVRYQNAWTQFAQLFTIKYWREQYYEWKELTAIPTGERLIDGEVMLWAFIEAGLIECAGALCTYFAVFWYSFGLSSFDVRQAALKQNVYFKPTSPILKYGDNQYMNGLDQFEALSQVQSAYFLSIFFIQIWNLFACKTRHVLPWKAHNLRNHHTYISIFIGCMMAALIVYTPVTNAIFQTSDLLHPVYFLIPTAFGILLYVYSIIRKFFVKTV